MPRAGSRPPWQRPPAPDADPLRILRGAPRHDLAGARPEGPLPVKLRAVADQPWDVKADVLVVPLFGGPPFDGAVAEIDRRAGGELSALAAFGELTDKRFSGVLVAGGDSGAGRILAIQAGPAASLDRETVVHVAAAA